MRKPLLERFNAKFSVDEATGCWPWAASKDAKGYGYIKDSDRRICKAHRIAYRLFVGEIPAGMFVCHRCDNPPCVNPAHLFLGTLADNNRDREAKGRGARGSKHSKAKLNEDKVREIRRLHAEGLSIAALARTHGVSERLVSGVIKRAWWRHVP